MHRSNRECSDPRERKQRLREAAQEGYAPAMYDYGLSCDDPGQRKHWLVMAAQEGNLCATHLLGQNPITTGGYAG
ncbi:MAG: hypothetical protein ACLP9L_01890 [Thermoguttaceae bacterium]